MINKLIHVIFIILYVFLNTSCKSLGASDQTTNWAQAHYKNLNGIVMITTAWGYSHLCTGTLLKPNLVLTAAHCLNYPEEDLYITYNCDNLNDLQCKKVRVHKSIKHPSYDAKYSFVDDLGIIVTDTPISDIQIVEISERQIFPIRVSVLMAGFGERNNNIGILYAGMGRIYKNYEFEFEAGKAGWNDPHPGDSGGPAYTLENGKLKLMGILSRSKMTNGNHSGVAVYTKPIKYIDWIYQVAFNYN